MNNGEGKFVPVTDEIRGNSSEAQRKGWFSVGDLVTLRGSKFRIKSVKPTELRLKLLPKEK